MASFAGAKIAIRDRLTANWSTTPVYGMNKTPPDPFPPVDGQGDLLPYVVLEILNEGSDIVGAGRPGDHLYRYDGTIAAHVFVPTGTGDDLAGDYADQIGELFRAAKFYDDVTPGCYVRSWSPAIGNGESGDDDGNWFRVTAMIPFEYFHRA